MNVTGEYYICKDLENDQGISLILNLNGMSLIELYLPNVCSLSKSSRYMAIEKRRAGYEVNLKYDINDFIGYKKNAYLELNRGRLETRYVSDNKSELSMIPDNDDHEVFSLVMIIPSWGRWTAKRLWNIIVK